MSYQLLHPATGATHITGLGPQSSASVGHCSSSHACGAPPRHNAEGALPCDPQVFIAVAVAHLAGEGRCAVAHLADRHVDICALLLMVHVHKDQTLDSDRQEPSSAGVLVSLLLLPGTPVVARRGWVWRRCCRRSRAHGGRACRRGVIGSKAALPVNDAVGCQAALSLFGAATLLFFRGAAHAGTAVHVSASAWLGAYPVRPKLRARREVHLGHRPLVSVVGAGQHEPWALSCVVAHGCVVLKKNIGPVRLRNVVGAVLLPVVMWGSTNAVDDDHCFGFCSAWHRQVLPMAPLVTLVQRLRGMSAAVVGRIWGTRGRVTDVVSSVAPHVVGRVVSGGASVQSALLCPAASGDSRPCSLCSCLSAKAEHGLSSMQDFGCTAA